MMRMTASLLILMFAVAACHGEMIDISTWPSGGDGVACPMLGGEMLCEPTLESGCPREGGGVFIDIEPDATDSNVQVPSTNHLAGPRCNLAFPALADNAFYWNGSDQGVSATGVPGSVTDIHLRVAEVEVGSLSVLADNAFRWNESYEGVSAKGVPGSTTGIHLRVVEVGSLMNTISNNSQKRVIQYTISRNLWPDPQQFACVCLGIGLLFASRFTRL